MQIVKTLVLIIAVLLALLSQAPVHAKERVEVAMVLFRGVTLAEKGFIETLKRNSQYDIHFTTFDAGLDIGKLDDIVSQLKDDGSYRLIYVFGTTATLKVMKKISKTPIVFNIVQRPIEAGIAKGWQSSGNNTTGASNYVSMESAFKTLSIVMRIHKLGFMYYVNDSSSAYQKLDIEAQQQHFSFSMVALPIQKKETIPLTLKAMLDAKPESVIFPADSLILANADQIISTLNKHKIPSVTIVPELVQQNGALIALGADYYTLGTLAAKNALEILNGKKPSELPIRKVDQLNIVINLKTADKLGVNFPIQLLRLSEVVR